jgi:hypothetical protein
MTPRHLPLLASDFVDNTNKGPGALPDPFHMLIGSISNVAG